MRRTRTAWATDGCCWFILQSVDRYLLARVTNLLASCSEPDLDLKPSRYQPDKFCRAGASGLLQHTAKGCFSKAEGVGAEVFLHLAGRLGFRTGEKTPGDSCAVQQEQRAKHVPILRLQVRKTPEICRDVADLAATASQQ